MKSYPHCPFDVKTLESLDFKQLFTLFSTYFHFNSNTQHLDNFNAFTNKNDIEMFYLSQKDFFRLTGGEEHDLRTLLKSCHSDFNFHASKTQVAKKYLLEDAELYSFIVILKLATDINRNYKDVFIRLLTPNVEDVTNITKDDNKLDKVIQEIIKITDHDLREIDFTRHPLLSPLYKKIFQIEKGLRKEIQNIAKEWADQEIISVEGHDIVENHFVIPVRSDRFRNGLGQIIYRSKSGQTLYIEPYQLQELVNEKRNLEADFAREKNKICHKYAECFFETSHTISYRLDSILILDRLIAHQAINRDFDLTCPDLSSDHINFEKMYHPLIKDAVANDLKLSRDDSGLLISGPNTGGKTVLLKTIALNLTLPHFGFFVSAQRASLPLTKNLYFISNDQQSLTEGLSSFSSEAETYLNIYNKVEKNYYIFIDEIFNSTTSSEASIISYTLIEKLLEKSAKVFISSHHEQLKEQVLKKNILTSAHMGFAKKDKGPTYKLHVGAPGHSHALDIFESLERKILAGNNISEAFKNTFNNSDEHSLHQQIKKLSELEMNLHEIENENKELKLNLEREEKAIQGTLSIKRKELEQEFYDKWKKAKVDIFEIGEEIKKQGLTNKHKIAIKLSQIAPKDETPALPEEVMLREPLDIILPNMLVYSASLNDHGKVIKVKKMQVYVQFKKVKSWVSKADLYKSKKKVEKVEKVKDAGFIEKSSETSTLFDARGMRREPFLNDVETKVYDLINGDVPFLDIIHGHGEGILKSSLYKYLKKFNEIDYDFIEGNQGTTRITTKKN